MLFYIADRIPRFTTGAMDARGNGQYLAETAAQRYGGRIVQVMLPESWYRENMPQYKAAFEDGPIEIPKDADVLVDHRAFVLEQGVAKISERRSGSRRQRTAWRLRDGGGAGVLRVARGERKIAYIPVRKVGARAGFESGANPFGAAPVEDEMLSGRVRGF